MALDSMKEIFDRMEQEGKPFWEIVLETDMDERQVTRNQSMAKMLITWQAMSDAADSYTGQRRSVSGLVGGDGMKMRQYCLRGEAMSGGYVSEVIAEALSRGHEVVAFIREVRRVDELDLVLGIDVEGAGAADNQQARIRAREDVGDTDCYMI